MNQQEVINELISSLKRNNFKKARDIKLGGDQTAGVIFFYADRRFDITIYTVKNTAIPQFRLTVRLKISGETRVPPFAEQLIEKIADIDKFISTLNITNSLEKIIEFYNCVESYIKIQYAKNKNVPARKDRLAIAFGGDPTKIEIEFQSPESNIWQIHIIIYPAKHKNLHKQLLLKEDLTLKLLLIKEGLSIKWLNITHIPSSDGNIEFTIKMK